MKKSLKVLFFGNERIATGINSEPLVFRSLLDSPHQVVGLVIHAGESTGRIKRTEPIVELAASVGVPVLNPARLVDVVDEIQAFGADVGVLVAYGKIIPKKVIELFEFGIINLHPSLLPKLRGSTPIETAILDGLQTSGVSVMSLVPEMDAGPVYVQSEYSISPEISKEILASDLQALGAPLILSTLDLIGNATATTTEQEHQKATYTNQIQKEHGLLDWTKPAEILTREIRAYKGWPKSYFMHKNVRYVVADADVSSDKLSDEIGTFVVDISTLCVQTSHGVLRIKSIQPEGKKEMPIQAFLNGYHNLFS